MCGYGTWLVQIKKETMVLFTLHRETFWLRLYQSLRLGFKFKKYRRSVPEFEPVSRTEIQKVSRQIQNLGSMNIPEKISNMMKTKRRIMSKTKLIIIQHLYPHPPNIPANWAIAPNVPNIITTIQAIREILFICIKQ